MYKIHVADREYNTFHLMHHATLETVETPPDFNPVTLKLFNQDVFQYSTNKAEIAHSSTRQHKAMPGVLLLEGNKVYGKHKKKSLYRCIPDDRRLPVFLIPYLIKLEFNKCLCNKYVVFQYNHWKNEHPRGMIVQIIGDVSELPHFYEYQLYCKSLYASIQDFRKKTMKALKDRSEDYFIERISQEYQMEDRCTWNIISIDPTESKDFDDAFSLKDLGENKVLLSIYISNVSFWLDILDVWESFSERIATIYLPDRKRPMLPTVLSDSLCSLQEKRIRFAFTLDIVIDTSAFNILSRTFLNTKIKVHNNLRYDTPKLYRNSIYLKTFKLVQELNKRQKYMDHINTCHDMIAYIMILMNYLSALEMQKHKIGIYRSVKANSSFKPPENTPKKVQQFLKMWNSFGSSYVKYAHLERHDMLDLDAYIHITSPIRRLVDLLNILDIQDALGLRKFTVKTQAFYTRWTNDTAFAYINKTMRSIRKIQNDCSLLTRCITSPVDKIYEGFIFDKIQRNDGLFQYMVYLSELRMVNRFTCRHDKNNYSKQSFKIYIFIDEHRFKQKIRLELQ